MDLLEQILFINYSKMEEMFTALINMILTQKISKTVTLKAI